MCRKSLWFLPLRLSTGRVVIIRLTILRIQQLPALRQLLCFFNLWILRATDIWLHFRVIVACKGIVAGIRHDMLRPSRGRIRVQRHRLVNHCRLCCFLAVHLCFDRFIIRNLFRSRPRNISHSHSSRIDIGIFHLLQNALLFRQRGLIFLLSFLSGQKPIDPQGRKLHSKGTQETNEENQVEIDLFIRIALFVVWYAIFEFVRRVQETHQKSAGCSRCIVSDFVSC
mmetsp:Transcript_22479/g.35949  ORF Transcript_22479/g.35949 Transcript_22479/m.35949 type:complete len:226 (-) Transcript_22479:822-1499(-)